MKLKTCRTVVPTGTGEFKTCYKPAITTVQVGALVCHYCIEHAVAATLFVAKNGQDKILDVQKKLGMGVPKREP